MSFLPTRCLPWAAALLLVAGCGSENAPGESSASPGASLGAPHWAQGSGTLRPSTTISKWYGKAAFLPEAPDILSDQRLAWSCASPNHLEWTLPADKGSRILLTAIRVEDSSWKHALRAAVFWQGGSGDIRTLKTLALPPPMVEEGRHSPRWQELRLTLPREAGRLSLVVQAQDPAMAAEPGPKVAWEQPRVLEGKDSTPLPDIVLVTIDTLRQDALGDMPYLRGLMAEGWQWQEAYAPSNWTLPAMASLFTGLPAEEHGCGRGPFAAKATGLAEDRAFRALGEHQTVAAFLASQGYATGMWHQNPFLETWSGLDSGFDRYVRCADRPSAGSANMLGWWQQQQQPRFLVVQEFTPHFPYDPAWKEWPDPFADLPTASWFSADLSPQERRSRFALDTKQRNIARQRYRHQLLALDQALSELIPALRAASPDCLILIHADHGEELWDAGAFEHGFSWDDSVVRVPLAAVWPGELAPAAADGPAPAHQLLTMALALLAERRGMKAAPFAETALRNAAGTLPQGGVEPLRIVAPLYRSETGGRQWTSDGGWQELGFDPSGTPGPAASLPSETMRQLVELGYTGQD